MQLIDRIKLAWNVATKQLALGKNITQRRLFEYLSGHAPIYMEDNPKSYIDNGYCFNPDVYAVVNHITNAISSVPFVVMKETNAQKAQQYRRLKSHWKYNTSPDMIARAQELKEEAFEEVDQADDLFRLLEKPNPIQAWPEFFENLMGFKFVTGNTYAHGIELTDNRFGEMWVLPPQYTRLKADESFETVVKGYVLNLYGKSTKDIPSTNVMHLKYWNPQYSSTGSHLYGMSPLKAARRVILASNAGQEALSKSFGNMGAQGMIYPDDPDISNLTREQQSQIESYFQQKSGPENYKSALVMSAKFGWEDFGMSPVDLEIIEADRLNTRKICNIYSFPSELLNDPETKTNANKKESRKQLWLDVCIPTLERSYAELNRWLTQPYMDAEGDKHDARYGDENNRYHIDYDVTGIEALAEDMSEKADWLDRAWWVTPNEKRDQMDMEAIDDDSFDSPWVDMGKMPLSQVQSDLGLTDEEVKMLEAEYEQNS